MVLPTYLGRGVRLRTLLKNIFSAKYDNSYFFCSRYFWFLVFARQPAKYTVENRYKPMQSRFVPEKNDQMSQTDTARIKTSPLLSLTPPPPVAAAAACDVTLAHRRHCCALALGGSVSLCFAAFNSNCFANLAQIIDSKIIT